MAVRPVGLSYGIALFGGGAQLTAIVSGGGIASVSIVCGGAYYAGVPTLVVQASGSDTITTTAVLTAVLTQGVITSVTIVNAGAGYVHPPVINIMVGSTSSALSYYMDPDSLYSLEQFRRTLTDWSAVGGRYSDVPSMLAGTLEKYVIAPAMLQFPTSSVASTQSAATAATVTAQNAVAQVLSVPIAYVQSHAASTTLGTSTATVTLSSPAAYHDSIIVCISTMATTSIGGALPVAAVVSMSCANVVFTQVSAQSTLDTNWGGYNNVEIWIGTVVVGTSGTTITATLSQATETYDTEMTAAEFSGLTAGSVIDGTFIQQATQSSQTACSVGPYANGNPSDLIFAVLQADIAGPPTTPTGFTALAGGAPTSSWGLWPVYQIVGVIGSYTANWSGGFGGGATDTMALIGGFKGE